MAREPTPLTDRDIETMWELAPSCLDDPIKWLMPLEFGAYNSSHHSATAMKLAKRGLVDFKARWAPEEQANQPRFHGARGSKVYRISAAGFEFLKSLRPDWRTREEADAFFKARTAEVHARKAAKAT